GYYTPIAGGGSSPLVARPLYYGMMLFREFHPKELFRCSFETGGVNATAYAGLDQQSRTKLVIINKDLKKSMSVNLSGRAFRRTSLRMALRAPSVESTQSVTLAGQQLSGADVWHGSFASRRRRLSVEVPSASALLLEFEGDRS
ncbi:MAG: glycosyl hydrolase family 79 C-terminal domain-containing protein, partial [Terriglobia bacterium]